MRNNSEIHGYQKKVHPKSTKYLSFTAQGSRGNSHVVVNYVHVADTKFVKFGRAHLNLVLG